MSKERIVRYTTEEVQDLRGLEDRTDWARLRAEEAAGIEPELGPISTELAYNYQTQQEERNDNAFDQTISVDVNGRPYIDTTGIDSKRFA